MTSLNALIPSPIGHFVLVVVLLGVVYLIADRLVVLMVRLAPRLGLMDQPGERRIHRNPIPRAGGIAVFLSLVVGVGLLRVSGLLDGERHLVNSDRWLLWFGGSALLLVGVGVLDDRFNLRAWWKLGAQIVAASLMFVGGQEQYGVLVGIQVPIWLDYLVYVAWVVVLVNAFNLIDGMDGLCAGLGLISIGSLCVLSIAAGASGNALFLGVMCMSLLGFLRHNFHPAKIFMGDAGSMLVGFFVAVAGGATVGRYAVVAGVLLPMLVAGIPLFDVMLAVWRRSARHLGLGRGKSPGIFGADKDHLHHRILSWGLTQRKAVLVLYGMALVLSLLALAPFLGGGNWLVVSGLALLLIGLVGLRYIAPIEFVETSNGLRALLRRPGSRSGTMLLYFVLDVVIVAASAALVLFLLWQAKIVELSKRDGLLIVLTFTGSMLLCLRFGHAHTRRWSRAGMNDFIELMVWAACGSALSLVFVSFFFEDLSYRMMVAHLLALVVALFGLVVPRCSTRLLQEGHIDALHRLRRPGDLGQRKTLLYGASDTGELFLCHLRLSPPERWSGHRLVGFIDDEKRLIGTRLRGFPVVGRGEDLRDLAERRGIQSVIVTTGKLSDQRQEELKATCRACGMELLWWDPVLECRPVIDAPERAEDPLRG